MGFQDRGEMAFRHLLPQPQAAKWEFLEKSIGMKKRKKMGFCNEENYNARWVWLVQIPPTCFLECLQLENGNSWNRRFGISSFP